MSELDDYELQIDGERATVEGWLWKAYREGFSESGEGWNGETPGIWVDLCEDRLRDKFEGWVESEYGSNTEENDV